MQRHEHDDEAGPEPRRWLKGGATQRRSAVHRKPATRLGSDAGWLWRAIRGLLVGIGTPMEPLPIPIEIDRTGDVDSEALRRDQSRW